MMALVRNTPRVQGSTLQQDAQGPEGEWQGERMWKGGGAGLHL